MGRLLATSAIALLLTGSVASAATLDQSNEVLPADYFLASIRTGVTQYQTFKPSTDVPLTRVDVFVRIPVFGTPAAPLNMSIVEDGPLKPTDIVVGSASASLTPAEVVASVSSTFPKQGWVSFRLTSPVSLVPGQSYAIRLSSTAPELQNYEWVAAPAHIVDPYPLGHMANSVAPLPIRGDGLFRTWVGPFDDLDGDGLDDAVDPDDDGDGIADTVDNCPIVANPLQEDDDRDGIGNACDSEFNSDQATAWLQADAAVVVSMLAVLNPPGVNGLIAKLTGNGSVLEKVSTAVSQFAAGEINDSTYVSRLDAALLQLDDLEAQVAAKIASGKIGSEDGDHLLAEIGSMRATILALREQASPLVGLPG